MRFFTFTELITSYTATKNRIINVPSTQERENLIALVKNVLDPLREYLGRPVHITSAYRSKELNAMIGGAKNSQHLKGEAADIVVSGLTPKYVCEKIIELGLPFDQLINEYGSWVHVSHSMTNNRGMYMRAQYSGAKTVYKTLMVLG